MECKVGGMIHFDDGKERPISLTLELPKQFSSREIVDLIH
ncbi:hypothetical protein HNR36_000346 [Ureibacillus thermosphaericus]|uniref:Uncharacterized protein n=1 Tax=Ureibacillus thermosphaericus TaxID=51173 RepID=A0A840PS32_URETH|nr:hypothetical protein [Ureibacillus thermosphaericus]